MPLYDQVQRKTKDSPGDLLPDDFNGNILEALKRYTKARPLELVADIVGNAGHDYDLPAGWSQELSTIVSIEYPIGNIPETYVDRDDHKIYATPTGRKIRLIADKPPVTASFRATFTGLHTEATLPEIDTEAVANLAASLCCRQLAQRYAGTSDPTIGADVVNYRSKGDEFARRAKELETLYKQAIGIKADDTTPAAMAIGTAAATEHDRIRLTHRGRG